MNEKGLIEQVLRLINANYQDIYVIDIALDKVYEFGFNETNSLHIKNEITYTDFISMAQDFVNPQDLSKYFDAINLNKLEIESQRGNSETKVQYRRLNPAGDYRWCVNIINYLPFEMRKLIFMMSEDVNERLIASEQNNIKLESQVVDYKNRINSETESISDALYQINNLLETNNNGMTGIKAKETKQYINSIFNHVSQDHPELNQAIMNKVADSTNFLRPSILIVDDSSIIRNSLKRIFQNEYNILMAKDGNEAIDIITKNVLNTSLNKENNIVGILLDLVMPGTDGFAVLDFMKNFNLFNRIPVAIISGDETRETRKKVYEYDIVDMLEKPFNTDNIKRRITKIINLHVSSNNLQGIIEEQNIELSSQINPKVVDGITIIINNIVNNIVGNAESIKLKKMVSVFANQLASKYPNYNLDNRYIDAIVTGSALYNIGAIAIADNEVITTKSIEQEIEYGLDIIEVYIQDEYEKKIIKNIIENSCEMFNGSGHPKGISGNNIPIEAQIVNLMARIIQASKSKSIQTVIKTIIEKDSSKYNPDLLDVLSECKKMLKDLC